MQTVGMCPVDEVAQGRVDTLEYRPSVFRTSDFFREAKDLGYSTKSPDFFFILGI